MMCIEIEIALFLHLLMCNLLDGFTPVMLLPQTANWKKAHTIINDHSHIFYTSLELMPPGMCLLPLKAVLCGLV